MSTAGALLQGAGLNNKEAREQQLEIGDASWRFLDDDFWDYWYNIADLTMHAWPSVKECTTDHECGILLGRFNTI